MFNALRKFFNKPDEVAASKLYWFTIHIGGSDRVIEAANVDAAFAELRAEGYSNYAMRESFLISVDEV